MITQSLAAKGAWYRIDRVARLVAILAPALLGLLLSAHSLSNRDIWLHNRAGRDFLAGGGIPITNRYSFTEPGHEWTDHEWLFQTCIALTDRLNASKPHTAISTAGETETREPRVTYWHALRMILVALLLLLLLKEGMSLRHGEQKNALLPAGWLGMPLLVGLLLIWPRLILRPELFSFLFFILLVREIEKSTLGFGWGRPNPGQLRTDLMRPAYLLSPFTPPGRAFLLVLVWAQFHGFAALGPVIWLLAALLAPLQSRLPGLRPPGRKDEQTRPHLGPADLALVLLFSLLALLLTPNGLSGLTYPLRALAQFREPGVQLQRLISELVPLLESPQSLGGTQWLFKFSLVWSAIWIFLAWGRISLLRILLWALAAWATIAAQRNIGFYALSFMMLHTGAASHPRAWWWGKRFDQNMHAPGMLCLTAVTVIVTCIFSFEIATDEFYLRQGVSRRFGGGLTPVQFPVELVPAISSGGHRTRLLSNVDGAGFLIDQTRAKVFIDGRTEAYSPKMWQDYDRLRAGEPDALALIKEHEIDMVALSLGSGAFHNLAKLLVVDPDWRLVTLGEGSLLFQPAVGDGPPADPRKILIPRLDELETQLFRESRDKPVRLADRCVTMAMLWELAGQTDRQEQLLRWGLSLVPTHPILAHNLGTSLMDRGDFKAALPLFQTAFAGNRRADSSLLNAGICKFRLGNAQEAEATFEKAYRINPRRLNTLLNLAITRKRLGDQEGAREALQQAVALRPDNQNLRQQLEQLDSRSTP